jgi:hypothetical protein
MDCRELIKKLIGEEVTVEINVGNRVNLGG